MSERSYHGATPLGLMLLVYVLVMLSKIYTLKYWVAHKCIILWHLIFMNLKKKINIYYLFKIGQLNETDWDTGLFS